MKVIKRFLNIIFLSWVFALMNISCNDDSLYIGRSNNADEIPVECSFLLPESMNTRAISNEKKSFADGEVVHITGTFTLSSGRIEKRYGALKYNSTSNKWEPVQASGLTWPNTADKGVFEAYYVAGLTGVLTEENGNPKTPTVYELAKVQTNADPLYAQSPVGPDGLQIELPYGSAVNFRFQHLLTYLICESVNPIVSTAYNFVTDKVYTSMDGEAHNFNNAFSFGLNQDKTISFKFIQSPDLKGNVFIPGDAKEVDKNGTNAVGFFLEPGYYPTFQLKYPSLEDNLKFNFLTFNYTPLWDSENTPPQLEAGCAYSLNILESPGITLEQKPEGGEEKWEDGDNHVIVDVDAFLTSISENRSYSEKNEKGDDVPITKFENGVLKLLRNVDFQNSDNYVLLKNGKAPDVPQDCVFDGGFHYIQNLRCPLFATNNGTIQNLVVKNVNATEVVLNQYQLIDGKESDQSRKGILCNNNKGKVGNIRMSNVNLVATVYNKNEKDTENIGCIVGSNSGTLETVRLSGYFSLVLKNDPADTDIDCTMNIGGLVGQNVGSVSDIAALESTTYSVSISNECTGSKGAYYIGGIVGLNESSIVAVSIPEVKIDASQSKCTKSFIGLAVGEITTSSGSSSTMSECNVAGRAVSGEVVPFDALDSGSYLGGICGAVLQPDNNKGGIYIKECIVVVNSLDNSRASADDIINSTGGCFGRIYSEITVSDITLTLMSLTLSDNNVQYDRHVGTFAGLVPIGRSWDSYSNNNINIIVNNSGIDNEIGADRLNG